MFLESERLIIRETTVSDAAFYFELFNDTDWITYISDKGLKTVEETRIYLEDILPKNKKLGGLGFFTVLLKETKIPIGTSTALHRDKLDFIDVGYGFLPKGRGKGYATEATKLMMEYIKNKFKQEKVLALTIPENKVSQKLLLKLGFVYVGMQRVFDDAEDCMYEYFF